MCTARQLPILDYAAAHGIVIGAYSTLMSVRTRVNFHNVSAI